MIQVAILGAGSMGRTHTEAYLHFPDDCRITAVINPHKEKAEALIKDFHLDEANAYTSLKDAFAADHFDLVSICTPPALHFEETMDALQHGKHVLLEKPMASSLEECDQMIEAAKENNCLLSVVFQNRYKNENYRLHEMLTSGKFGSIRQAIVNSFWWRGESYYDIYWRGTWEKECGGVFTAQAIHHIDLLLWMMGKEPDKVSAMISNVGHHNSEMEDVGVSIWQYPDALAQLNASLVAFGQEKSLIFQTDKLKLSVPWDPTASLSRSNGFPLDDPETVKEASDYYHSIPVLPYEGHAGQIKDVLNYIKTMDSTYSSFTEHSDAHGHDKKGSEKKRIFATGVDGREAIEMIMATYKSAVEDHSVTVSLRKNDPFYQKSTMVKCMPHFHEKTRSVEQFDDTTMIL